MTLAIKKVSANSSAKIEYSHNIGIRNIYEMSTPT